METQKPDEPAREPVRTLCKMCNNACGINVFIEDGRIRNIEGMKEHPVSRGHLCLKAKAAMELVNVPDRLKYPMKRNSGKWERISWDEALDIVANKLNDIKEEYGPQGVVIHRGQGARPQDYLIERFCNVFGTPNYSTTAGQCHVAGVMGNVLTYGFNPTPDFENSKCIVIWGSNPAFSDPLEAIMILEARKKGAKLIVIDPRVTPLARKADIHVQLRPGTDGALALGMLNVIVSAGVYDQEFVNNWTVGFDKLAELVKEYTPEKVSGITWVPGGVIEKVSHLYATTKPACIKMGTGSWQHSNGVQNVRAMSILQAITGNLDVPGGAIIKTPAALADLSLKELRPGGTKPVGALEHPLFYEFTGVVQVNTLANTILTGKPYPVKAMLIAGGNPVLTSPNAKKVIRALKRLEFLVVMDLFMTKTASLASIVLPAAAFLERMDLCVYNNHQLAMVRQKVVEPPGECWPDWRFWFELARRMGYEEYFPWGEIEETFPELLGPFKEKTVSEGYQKYRENGFKTPSGKVEIYSERLEKAGYDPLPVYREPEESLLKRPDLAEKYPLVLTTGARMLPYFHSQYRNLPSLRKTVPGPWMEIHPKTAGELGIEDGEETVVESLRGSIKIRVRVTEDILPGMVQISHGWNEANVNILTDDQIRDPISGFPQFRASLCRVKKI